MYYKLKKLYSVTPLFILSPIKHVPYAWLAGKYYRETLKKCIVSDKLSRSEIYYLQEALLGDLLKYAVHFIPLYSNFQNIVLKYSPFDALKEFPLLTKNDIQNKIMSLQSKSNISCHPARTSGSSGNQLTFYEDDNTYAKEMGFMHSQWSRVGYSPKLRKASFRDMKLRYKKDNIFWQYNPIHNELQFSPFHLSSFNMPHYINALKRYSPTFIHGYPSAIDILAEYILSNNIKKMPVIKAAFLGGEGCSILQRDRISQAFSTKIFTWYGHSERVVLGGECEFSDYYHSFPEYGITEIVRPDGSSVEYDEEGEIVGTGFLNRYMPLIRYRTGDYATKREPSCSCGRMYDRFSHVRGRRNEEGFAIGKSGAKISIAALETPSIAFSNVKRFQYVQNERGQLLIMMIVGDNYQRSEETRIIHDHQERLHGELDIMIKYVNEIPLTQGGKQRWFVSKID